MKKPADILSGLVQCAASVKNNGDECLSCPYYEDKMKIVCWIRVLDDAAKLIEKLLKKTDENDLRREQNDATFEALDRFSAAYYGKQTFFKQDNGQIYDRNSADYISLDEAMNRFAKTLSETVE